MLLELHNLKNIDSVKKKSAKRVGRGNASGKGGTSGKGHKGQKARSGYTRRLHFEGGQLSLFRRIPLKRGARCSGKSKKIPCNLVNIIKLNNFNDDDIVDKISLFKKGIISKLMRDLKILGIGDLTKRITVRANAFSSSAKHKIESVGGKCEVI